MWNDTMAPDQDHRDVNRTEMKESNPEEKEDTPDDSNILKARIISLEMTVKEKEIKLVEIDSELVSVKLESSRLESDVLHLQFNIKEKVEVLDILTAKVNALEDSKTSHETKLKTWGLMIKKLNTEQQT